MQDTYHPFQSVEDEVTPASRCERCGLPQYAAAHLPILVERRDHGFRQGGGGRFATVEEAKAYIAEQDDQGRRTSFTGRCQSDIAYHVIDLSAGPVPVPGAATWTPAA